ncbi:DoxX-like family protein [Chryseolinea sp. T2]|uniref:DoxX-like family protein n=1 Tax=Chryseolinea sp. T2 TaxID=3129255 RepID=UPI003076E45D
MNRIPHILATAIIALVWFVNGFFCKVLSLVPRHQEIVARILGEEDAWIFTKAIGVAEILMVVWILSRIKSRLCAVFQMAIVGIMNIIEFVLAPDLLLFGRMNIVFASIFIVLIYVNEFVFRKRGVLNEVA